MVEIPRIAITIEHPSNEYKYLVDILKEAGIDAAWLPSAGADPMEYARLIAGYDGVIAGGNPFNRQVLEMVSKKLRIIARYGIGVDNIDVACATKLGIPVTNTPGTMATSVAGLTIGLMLAVGRDICTYDRKIKTKQRWRQQIGSDLEGKTIGLIGFGQIAKKVAQYLQGFHCPILAYDISFDMKTAKQLGVKYASPDDIACNADYISLHVPLNEHTKHLVNADFLHKMKPAAYLINTGRGALIDEKALVKALQNGLVAGAALDVLEEEPVNSNNPLLSFDNVIITPHVGAITRETFRITAGSAAGNLIAFFSGRTPPNLLNPEYREYIENPSTD